MQNVFFRSTLLFLTLTLSLHLIACTENGSSDSTGGNNGQEPDSELTDQHWMLDSTHYDTLAPNPQPLTGGAASIEDLIASGLDAVAANDRSRLDSLMVTPEEFTAIIQPEYGKHWPGARDTRPTVVDWIRMNHFGSSEKGVRRVLRDFGGEKLKLHSFTFADSTQDYPSFQIHQKLRVEVTDQKGREGTFTGFGSVIEKDGRFKFLSYRDRD